MPIKFEVTHEMKKTEPLLVFYWINNAEIICCEIKKRWSYFWNDDDIFIMISHGIYIFNDRSVNDIGMLDN